MKTFKRFILALGVALFWLTVWQIAAIAVDNPLILPSPVETALRLFKLCCEKDFWGFTGLSLLRIFSGIAVAIPTAWLFAALCYKSKIISILFAPAVTLMKSTPVVSFILIAIFLVDRRVIPSAITFMMVFPVIYENVREGMLQAPKDLLELAHVYRVNSLLLIRRIYFPAIKPFFVSALTTSIGLAVKAGIAAEVVAYIPDSIGKMLSDAKSYMEPADLLAWTTVIIVISLITEKTIAVLLKLTARRKTNAAT